MLSQYPIRAVNPAPRWGNVGEGGDQEFGPRRGSRWSSCLRGPTPQWCSLPDGEGDAASVPPQLCSRSHRPVPGSHTTPASAFGRRGDWASFRQELLLLFCWSASSSPAGIFPVRPSPFPHPQRTGCPLSPTAEATPARMGKGLPQQIIPP